MKVANSDMSVARRATELSHIVKYYSMEKFFLVKLRLMDFCRPAGAGRVKYLFLPASWRFPRSAGVGRAWPDPRSTTSHRGRLDLASTGLRHRFVRRRRPLPESPACSHAARAPAWRCGLASCPAGPPLSQASARGTSAIPECRSAEIVLPCS